MATIVFEATDHREQVVDASWLKPVVVGEDRTECSLAFKNHGTDIRRHAEIHGIEIYRNTGMDGQ